MSIKSNIEAVRAEIAAACASVDRDPAEVRLLPVSKTHPASAVAEAFEAGAKRVGENKVQEMVAKHAEIGPDLGVEFAIIGHLQTNKARDVVEIASEFQALDSLKLARHLDRRLQAASKSLDVLIEVNSSGEESKFGILPENVVEFAKELSHFETLRPLGLMTLAANTSNEKVVAACFERMVELQRRLRDEGAAGSEWNELSMGMSGDYRLAIQHGSTCVRVGTAIFGKRDYSVA